MESIAKSEDKNILQRFKVFLNYAKYIILSILILYVGLLITPGVGGILFTDVVGRMDPMIVYKLMVIGPHSVSDWAIIITAKFVHYWPFAAFIIWAVIDSKKFKARGINTRPYLWGIGMIFPAIMLVFPLYLIRRNITWQKKVEENKLGSTQGSSKREEKIKGKRKWVWKSIKILLVLFIVYTLTVGLLVQFGSKNKTISNFLVNYSLSISCGSGKSGCDELRPLPKILQNKKIVFNDNTSIEFDPRYRPELKMENLDVLGSFNTNLHRSTQENIVDPNLGEHGYLSEREYKIIRAVYHYNCSYCVDSSDYAYVVLEDSKGNRFSSLLSHDYWDPSMDTARTLQWDERVPYDLGRDGELGKLVDITQTSTQ